jgi:hypothetical protein
MAKNLSANISGTWKTADNISVNVSGTWKAASKVFVNVSGTWKEIWAAIPPLSATLNSDWSYKWRGTNGTLTSDSITCTPSGGTSPYTYLWEHTGGDTFTVISSTSASTTFRATGAVTEYKEGTYRCKVTDAASQVAYSEQVSIGMEWSV